jgi:hypothetical protein
VGFVFTTACGSRVTDGGDGFQLWRVAANTLNKQSWAADKGRAFSIGVGRGSKLLHTNIISLQNAASIFGLEWVFWSKRSKLIKTENRLGTCNNSSLYREGLLMTIAKEVPQCKLHLVTLQEIKCDRTIRGAHSFLCKREWGYELDTGSYTKIISAVKRVECVNDKMSYIILRGRWCHVIVLNVHAPTVDKIDDVKDIFYEELEHVFDTFLKYHT